MDRWATVWATVWPAVKDIILTGVGVIVIVRQVLSVHPSDVLLVTGLALTVPSVAGHAGALLSGHTGGHSSPPGLPSPPTPPPSSPPHSGNPDE